MDNVELEVINNLLRVDNSIMGDNLTIDDVLKPVSFTDINVNNALIIYDGNIKLTKKIVNSNITNSILFPNYNYLGINKYLISKRDDLNLSFDKSVYTFLKKEDEFDVILVLNDLVLFNSIKDIYSNVKFIEI